MKDLRKMAAKRGIEFPPQLDDSMIELLLSRLYTIQSYDKRLRFFDGQGNFKTVSNFEQEIISTPLLESIDGNSSRDANVIVSLKGQQKTGAFGIIEFDVLRHQTFIRNERSQRIIIESTNFVATPKSNQPVYLTYELNGDEENLIVKVYSWDKDGNSIEGIDFTWSITFEVREIVQ